MKNKIYFMYTGQGSQYFGMCKKYYETDEVFRYWMDQLNDIALNEMGHSVLRYLYEEQKKDQQCDDIVYTHVAICMIEYAMTQSLMAKGIIPDAILGSSLGEYVCMAVSGMISIRALIRLLIDQAYFLKRECPEGKMLAVIANYEDGLIDLQGVDVAAVDYDRHFSISGGKDEVNQKSMCFKERGIDVFDIPVHYGFHSRSIDCIEKIYKETLDMVGCLSKAAIPVLSSSQTGVVDVYDKEGMWKIIRGPIHFQKLILEYCSDPNTILIDVGPSSTLAGFCKNILKRREGIYGIINLFHMEKANVDKILEKLI